jgi:hypothetical protein
MTLVLDSGSPRNDYKQVADSRPDVDGFIRYIAAPGDWRRLSPTELQACFATRLKMGVVHEVNRGERLALGASAGTADGRTAKPLLDELNWPNWRPVYCASDVDMAESQYPAGLAYVIAHSQATGRLPGVYGESGLGHYCEQRGVFFTWNTNATSWSSQSNPDAELQQHYDPRPVTPGTDANDVWRNDWGGYHPSMPSFATLNRRTMTDEELVKAIQQEFVNSDARFNATVLPKIDAILNEVDPVGQAAGKPGQGPDHLRTQIDEIATKLGT